MQPHGDSGRKPVMRGEAAREKCVQMLEQNGVLTDVPHGSSMWPMMKNRRDRFVAKAPTGRLKKWDIPVYYQPNTGHVTVHRIVRVNDDGYVIRGDNCYFNETNIRDDDILAVVCGFYRKKRFVTTESRGYRTYVRVWQGIYPFRFAWHCTAGRVIRLARRVFRRIFRKKRT